MSKVLIRLYGSMILSSSWKQELIITEHGVEADVMTGFKRFRMYLPYDRIAQVNIVKGILVADLEVVNTGGADNLMVQALNKNEAEQAKSIIETKVRAIRTAQLTESYSYYSIADELRKLADLKNEGILTEEEFQVQKSKILNY